MLDRREEHLAVGNRPGSGTDRCPIGQRRWQAHRDRSQRVWLYGAGAGAGFGGPALSLYDAPAIYVEESDVFTHSGPLAAFRAPGHPQGCFALEQAMDELAERLHLDPLVLRDKNDTMQRDVKSASDWRRLSAGEVAHPLDKGHGSASWEIRRGIGVAQGCWYHLVNLESSAEVRIHRDGSVEVLTGVQDIGGGIRTPWPKSSPKSCAPLSKVKVTIGDTRLPTGTRLGWQRHHGIHYPAAREVAYAAKQALSKELQGVLGLDKLPDLHKAVFGR